MPIPKLIVNKDGSAALELRDDTTGRPLGPPTPLTPKEALEWFQRVVEDPDYRLVGVAEISTQVRITNALIVLIERHYAAFKAANPTATDADWKAEIQAIVTSEVAIGFLATNDPETARDIWPGLVEGEDTSDTILGGDERQGTGPLPENRRAGSPRSKGSPPGTGGGQTPDGARAGDPVLPASGQFLIEDVDLEVDGIGLDFRLERVYLHDTDYNGPLGPRWDHSYNLWLREAVEARAGAGYEYVVYRSTGRLRADRFVLDTLLTSPDVSSVATGTFVPPPGTHERLVKVNGAFALEQPDGRRVEYGANLRAARLRDLNGNDVRLVYGDQDPGRLTEVIDSCGRRYQFRYADDRLVEVHDVALGRSVEYAYDGQRRLVAVRQTTGVPSAPHRCKGYRYWGDGAPPGMEGNIVAVIDPRGSEVLQVRYGIQPSLASFNRVVEQRDGGITQFDYEFVYQPAPGPLEQVFAASVMRVRMQGPDGDEHEMDYNAQGRMVRHTVIEQGPLGPQAIETRWSYNADGRVIREERPGGGTIEYEYGRERFEALGGDAASASTNERMRFGHLLRVVERARPGTPGPRQRVTEFDYHPAFGFVIEQRGPFYANASGMRIDGGPPFTTRFVYDTRANLVEIRYPDCTLSDGSVQTGRRIELVVDVRGRLSERRLPLGGGATLVTGYEYASDGDPSGARPNQETLDPNGLAIQRVFGLDAAGRVVRVQEPSGVVTDRVIDDLGRVWSEAVTTTPGDPPSRVETDWAPHDRPKRVRMNRVDASGTEDPPALLERSFEFDLEGEVRRSRLRSADGRIDRTVVHLHGPGGRLDRLQAHGVDSHFRYNARGQLVEQTTGAQGVEPSRYRYEYDGDGVLVGLADSSGRRERFVLDGFGRVARHVSDAGTEHEYEWDPSDRLLAVTVRGRHPDHAQPVRLRVDRYGRDEAGRVRTFGVAVFDPADTSPAPQWSETNYLYDRADRVVRVVGPMGYRRDYGYDSAGRLVRMTDDAGTDERWTYDDAGRRFVHRVEIQDAAPDGTTQQASFEWQYRADRSGRLEEQIDPLGNVHRFEWDSRGRLTATVDPGGVRRDEALEPDGAVRSIRLAPGTPDQLDWSYRRDREGNVMRVDGPRGQVVSLRRDPLGRATSVTFGPPTLGETTTFEYDSLGRLTRSLDGRGVAREIRYGEHGLPDRVRYDRSSVVGPPGVPGYVVLGPAEIRFSYDGMGQLTEADDGSIVVRRRYDSRGLPVRESVEGVAVAWSYDLTGHRSSFTFPDGRRIAYARDPAGRLLGVSETASGAANPAPPVPGGIIVERWPWGAGATIAERWRQLVERRRTQDGAGRIIGSSERRLADQRRLLDVRRVFDRRGLPQFEQLEAPAGTETAVIFSDAQGRLRRTSETAALPTVDTTPLRVGTGAVQSDQDAMAASVAAQTLAAGPDTRSYQVAADGALERVTHVRAGTVVEDMVFGHDAGGRLVSVGGVARTLDGAGLPATVGARSFAFDGAGMLAAVTSNGTSTSLVRDPLGRPHQLVSPAGSVVLVHDGDYLVEARDATGPLLHYLRDDESGALLEVARGGVALRPLPGLDGCVHGYADATGAPMSQVGFDPFGRVEGVAGSPPEPGFGFQGLFALPGLGLYLTANRVYDPSTGTFLEPDPAGLADGLNRYQFARGNPYAFRDETGLTAQPQGKSGREAATGTHQAGRGGTGTHNQYGGGAGDDRELRWYERALLAVGGAVGSIVDFLVIEPAKMLYDIGGLYVQSLGIASGLWDYEHDVASGIGHMAAGGKDTGDILVGLGRNMIETPGRVWDAAERGDYWAFGAEAMNLYALGRQATGVARGTASWAHNRGVRVLARVEQAGAVASEGSMQVMFRGAADQQGVGVLWVRNAARLTAADLERAVAAVRDMDFQAGMSGGFVRQRVSSGMRAIANRVASIGKEKLGLDRSTHAAGHLPDTGAGGSPIGIIMGLPKRINASWGGQLGRYQPGFRFQGFSLVDRATGQFLYPSLALESAPLPLRPW